MVQPLINSDLRGTFGVVFLAAAMATRQLGAVEEHPVGQPPRPVAELLQRSCIGCHDGDDAEAGLDLSRLRLECADISAEPTWARLIDRVTAGEMPPQDAEQPTDEARAAFLTAAGDWLGKVIRDHDAAAGRVRGRRLTRLQVERTLHAVLGIDRPLADLLPDEGRPRGFTTIAEQQTISHHHLERHLAVVDTALDAAFSRLLSPTPPLRRDLPAAEIVRRNPGVRCREPELRDGYAVVWSCGMAYYGRIPAVTAPEDGWYRFRVTASGLKPPASGGVWTAVHAGPCVSNAPLLRYVTAFEATAEPREIRFETWLPKGHMLEIRPQDASIKKASFQGGQVGTGEGEPQNVPGVAIERIVMEQFHAQPSSLTRRLLLGDVPLEPSSKQKGLQVRPHDPARDLEHLLRRFARRAWRRPVDDAALQGHLNLARRRLEEGAAFVDALRTGYRSILCGPEFLYFTEQPGLLDDHAVAARLSYFLTNAPPDDDLSAAADDGRLHEPLVLRRQADRLLGIGTRATDADVVRGGQFVAAFAAEWLDLDQIDFTEPDRRLHPLFDPIVKEAMVVETRRFLEEMLRENLSVGILVAADHSYLNSRLARFYRVEGVTGDTIQRVSLPAGSHRGGLLTQGAVLKVTANGTTTSPVVRGGWVMERLLGVEVPPPPAGVPAIEPDIRGASTIREQLARHRSDASCGACHRRIDPVGFALEAFDPAGQFRERYAVAGSRRPGSVIDTADVLPDGRAFRDIDELRQLLATDEVQLARGLAGQLLSYGTGGRIRWLDRQAITRIVKAAGPDGYGFRSILYEVITDPVFLSK
jgi:mono/diheme cytochrome c family protein